MAMSGKTTGLVYQALTAATFIFMIVMNAVSASIGFSGRTQADLSNRYYTHITPSYEAFGIWTLIFIMLAVWTVRFCLPSSNTEHGMVPRVKWVMALNFLANGFWGLAFNNDIIWLSLVLMFIVLGTLAYTYHALQVGVPHAGDKRSFGKANWIDFLTIDVPISLYLGWVTAATLLNIGVAIVASGVTRGQDIWGTIFLVVAGLAGLYMAARHHDFVYAAVITWALSWIAVAQTIHAPVYWTALIGAILVGIASLGALVLKARDLTGKGHSTKSHSSSNNNPVASVV